MDAEYTGPQDPADATTALLSAEQNAIVTALRYLMRACPLKSHNRACICHSQNMLAATAALETIMTDDLRQELEKQLEQHAWIKEQRP